MIKTFKCKETAKIWNEEFFKRLPHDIQKRALQKLRMLYVACVLDDLKSVVSSKFFNSLKEACEKKGITNALSAKNPQEYAKLLHEVYKENLHKFGLKYTTNFSNLV